jgi:hypothetical protein
MSQLWERALDDRRLDRDRHHAVNEAQRAGARKGGYAGRRYPEMVVGARYGCFTVTALLGRGHQGRADLRVRIQCDCGREYEVFEFMARYKGKVMKECRHR